MKKQEWDTDWLHFTRRTRRGIFVLIFLFIAVAISPRLYYNYFYTIPKYDIKIEPLTENEQNNPKKEETNKSKSTTKESKYSQPEEMFNPNTYSVQDWVNIGLTEKQGESILKYLNKGGKVKIKSDLKKLYVIDDELYRLLEPKIDLPEFLEKATPKERIKDSNKTNSFSSNKDSSSVKESLVVEPISINKATARELQTIKGIGSFYANEIIKMREKYGGIIDADQLLDIYGMDEEKLSGILPFLNIDKGEISKLNINTVSVEQLKSHPLISYDIAKSIVFYRENYKSYKSLDDLLLLPYVDSKTLRKIKPYLKVE